MSDIHQVIPGVALPGILLSETGVGADHTLHIIGEGADHIHHITDAVAAALTLHMAVVDPTRDLCPAPHPTLPTIGTALLMIGIVIIVEADDTVLFPGASLPFTRPVYLLGAAKATREVCPLHQGTLFPRASLPFTRPRPVYLLGGAEEACPLHQWTLEAPIEAFVRVPGRALVGPVTVGGVLMIAALQEAILGVQVRLPPPQYHESLIDHLLCSYYL